MYNQRWGQIGLKIASGQRLEYTISGDPSLAVHFTILPHLGKSVATAAGDKSTLSAAPFAWRPGAWFEHAGARFLLPADVVARWPLMPHDPYTKDGHAEIEEGRIVLEFPAAGQHTIVIEVPAPAKP
jgi:hypothetical protein